MRAVAAAGSARGQLARSALTREGGFVVLRLVDRTRLGDLRREAAARHGHAQLCLIPTPPGDGELRGQPDRWNEVAVGGPALMSFFGDPGILSLLNSLTGIPCRTHGQQGTFTYYRSPGQYLGLHRDAPGCDLAIITCIVATAGDGGELIVYPKAACRPLSEVRAEPERGAHRIQLEPGDSVVLLGSLVPHRVTPLRPGQTRVVAPLCYELNSGPSRSCKRPRAALT